MGLAGASKIILPGVGGFDGTAEFGRGGAALEVRTYFLPIKRERGRLPF